MARDTVSGARACKSVTYVVPSCKARDAITVSFDIVHFLLHNEILI